MKNKSRLSMETFLSIAKASGLDMKDSHTEELYTYVENVFPNFKVTEHIELTHVEPMTTFILPEE